MPKCPAPLVTQKKCGPPTAIDIQEVTQLLEPNFPEHDQHHHHRHHHRHGQNVPKSEAKCSQQQQQQQQQQSRNVYTWISAPRAIYNNKRLMRMSNERRGTKPSKIFTTCVKMPTLSAHQQQNQQQELLELESPAFAIVQSDHYRTGNIGKPNAIVRPLRHTGQHREVIEGQHIVNLHPDYKLLHELEEQLIRNNRGRDGNNNNSATGNGHDTRPNYGPEAATGEKTERAKPQQHEFSRELDAKLRQLQSDSSKRSSKNVGYANR
uniref:Uncharacterized protein n=1 Tax=Anopheles atroparvus TaxID=41427 RepID=A0A182IKR5_ANOAO